MQKTYGPKAVCQSVGISQRQLGYWGMIGVIKPTKQMHGAKVFNRYTDEDIETLNKVKKLIEEGFFVSKAAEKIHKMKESISSSPEVIQAMPSVDRNGRPQENGHQGLSSSLYLEVRLCEELSKLSQHRFPMTCIAIQVLFPAFVKLSQQKNEILFKLSLKFASVKQPSEVISYKKDSIFLWLMPNRTMEQAHLLSKEVKEMIESPEWDVQDKKFRLQATFGFSDYSALPRRESNLLVEAENSLLGQGLRRKSAGQ